MTPGARRARFRIQKEHIQAVGFSLFWAALFAVYFLNVSIIPDWLRHSLGRWYFGYG
jgi:hypothetical protein